MSINQVSKNTFDHPLLLSSIFLTVAYFAGTKRLIHMVKGANAKGLFLSATLASAGVCAVGSQGFKGELAKCHVGIQKCGAVALAAFAASTISRLLGERVLLSYEASLKFGALQAGIVGITHFISKLMSSNPPAVPFSYDPFSFQEAIEQATPKALGYEMRRGEFVTYNEGEVIASLDPSASQYAAKGQRPPACGVHAICAIEHLTKPENFQKVVQAYKDKNEGVLSEVQNHIIKDRGLVIHGKFVEDKKKALHRTVVQDRFSLKDYQDDKKSLHMKGFPEEIKAVLEKFEKEEELSYGTVAAITREDSLQKNVVEKLISNPEAEFASVF